MTAIRGNNDTQPWAQALPETTVVRLADVSIYLVHDAKALATEPAPAGVRVVVAGHSHRPVIETRGDALLVNPGSAGRRRFSLPVSVGELLVVDGRVEPRIIPLPIDR